MTVRVLAFARIREVLGFGEQTVALPDGAGVERLWERLANDTPALQALRASTRVAVNGTLAPAGHPLRDGDEVALLPPVGGG